MSLSDWMRLDVGGKPFRTTRSTLVSYPGSLLANMFDPKSGFKPAYSENGIFYLDADPKYFGIILNWLRYNKVIADSDTNLSNVAVMADYFGIVDLAEKLKPVGKWVEFKDLPVDNQVSAMKMTLSKNPKRALVQIAKFPNGLRIEKEDNIKAWGGKCLKLDLKGRAPVWIPTVMGQVPSGAIAVEGRGGENMYIGRKFWNAQGSLQEKVQIWTDGDSVLVPHKIETDEYIAPTNISAGYVNEKGIFGITFCSCVLDIFNTEELFEEQMVTFTNSEFEVLCAF